MSGKGKEEAKYCCPDPVLQFEWHLGADPDRPDYHVLGLDGVACATCGATYVFDTQGGAVCPVVQRANDGSRIVLKILAKPVRLQ